jgi:hypothetical protein
MEEISAGLAAIGLDAAHIHTEPFGPAPGLTPGIASAPARPPHPPAGALDYDPDPVEPPATGSALICCSRPRDDVVLDL